MNDADRATELVILHSQAGQRKASDLENAATALKIPFDHYQEIGLNATLQKQFLNHQNQFLNFHLSDNQVSAFQAKLATSGVNVDASAIRSHLNPDLQDREQFLSMVKTIGLYQTEMDAVAELHAKAETLATQQASMSTSRLSSLSPDMAAQLELVTAACDSCFLLAAVGLATGCTLTAAACGAGIGTCTVCAFGG